MASQPDTIVVTGPVFQQSPADGMLVTPTGGTQGTLADKLAAGLITAAPITATTLNASGAVAFSNASLTLSAIPTADPHVVGRVWANSGVLTISAG